MKKAQTILILILFTMAGCGDGKQSTDGLITVDVTAKYPKKELILQDIFDVEYIALETSDEFITSALIYHISKDIIVIKNRSADGDILFFDRNGTGLKKINRKGQGPEEYALLLHIIVDEDNNEMFLTTLEAEMLVYDLSGNFKRRFNRIKGLYFSAIANFDQNHLIFYWNNYTVVNGNIEWPAEAPENKFFLMDKKDGSIKGIDIPFNERKWAIIGTDPRQVSTVVNRLLMPLPHNNWIITEISSDTIYTVLPDFSIEPFMARTPSIQSMNPEIYLYPGAISDRYCFMQTVKKEYDFATGTGWPRIDLVYDRQENAIFEYVVYNDDFSDKRSIKMIIDQGAIASSPINNEIAFCTKIEAFDLVKAYEEGKLKGKLKEIAATMDEEDNPVIMIAKHKK